MLIECVQALEVESRIPMELSLQDDRTIRFVGRIASCQVVEHGDPRPYNTGIEFLDLTRKDNEMLTTFVEYCAAVEDGKRKLNMPLTTFSALSAIHVHVIGLCYEIKAAC